jgi:hypothetical protein
LAAVVTGDGESLIQATPQSEWIARAVTIGADGTAHTDPELILDANLHDGTPAQRQFVADRHLPYPPHALVEPGRLMWNGLSRPGCVGWGLVFGRAGP